MGTKAALKGYGKSGEIVKLQEHSFCDTCGIEMHPKEQGRLTIRKNGMRVYTCMDHEGEKK